MKHFLLSVLTGMAVVSSFAAEHTLQHEIAAAVRAGKKSIRLTGKVYRIGKTVQLRNLSGFTLDGNGARIVMTSPFTRIFNIHSCPGITLKNLTLDYDPLPFTQGVITQVAPDGKSFEFELDEGYPRLLDDFVRNNRLHRCLPDGSGFQFHKRELYGKVERVSPSRGRFIWRRHGSMQAAVGDRIVLDTRKDYAIFYNQSPRAVFEDLTIYTSPGLIFCGRNSEGGDRFERIRIVKGPRPAGAKVDRLISSSADAINLSSMRRGPVIRDCEFSFMGDDAVNFHSPMLCAVRMETPTRLLATRFNRTALDEVLRPGDEVRFLAPGNFRIKGTRKLRSCRYRKDNPVTRGEFDRGWKHFNYPKWFALDLELEPGPYQPEPGDFLDFPAIAVGNYHIVNNDFHDFRAGVRMMAGPGVVENNRFCRMWHALSVASEYGYWREAGWAGDIVIRNNHFKEVCFNRNVGSYMLGAISVYARLDSYQNAEPGHRNIRIENNVIDGSEGAGIFVFAADGVTINNNTLKNVCTGFPQAGKAWGFSGMEPVWLQNCRNVTVNGKKK